MACFAQGCNSGGGNNISEPVTTPTAWVGIKQLGVANEAPPVKHHWFDQDADKKNRK